MKQLVVKSLLVLGLVVSFNSLAVYPKELDDSWLKRNCRVAHDRLEHDNQGYIKGISTFYVCPDNVLRVYRSVKTQ